MKFACDACQAQYMIADEKVRDRAVKVKCKKCEHVIVVRPPKASAANEDEREGTIDGGIEAGGIGGATEESARLPSMGDRDYDDSNEVDSDETHILDEDEARTAAASFGEAAQEDVPAPPPAADAADATHVAINPLAGMKSEDFNAPADADADDGAFAPSNDLVATTQGEAIDASVESPMGGDENMQTVVSGPGVFDDSKALGGDLALNAAPDDELSPFAGDDAESPFAGDDGAFAGGPTLGDALADELGAPLDGDGAGVPEPPSGGELEAALSQEGAPLADPPPFADPSADLNIGMPDVPALDDATGKSLGHEDPTVAGPMADLPAAPAEFGGLADAAAEDEGEPEAPKDELDEQLAGAFNQMFSEPGALPFPEADDDGLGHHDPTSVIDPDEMNALRGQAANDGMFRDDSSFDDLAAMGGGGDEAEEPEWHVAIDDEDVGPLSIAEVRDEVTSGRLLRDSLVWKVGMDDWYPAEDVPEIADLFVPAPRSLEVGGGASLAGFDVGEPVDDMGPSPFGGPENSDPFGQVQDLHNDPDPSWQPHGLTDVYQAANLAEAGGAAPPPPAMDLPADDESEGGWRPGAASALSALVANEIDRIDAAPVESEAGPLLPADDATAQDDEPSSPALLGGLAGAELSGGIAAAPFDADLGPALDAGPALAPFGAAPPTGVPPAYPQAVPPPEQGRSNLVLAVMALAGLMIVMIGVVAVVAILKIGGGGSSASSGGQVAAGQTGDVNPVGAAAKAEEAKTPKAVASTPNAGAKGTDAKAVAPESKEKVDPPPTEPAPTKVALIEKKEAPKEAPKASAPKSPKTSGSTSRSGRRSRGRATAKPAPKPTPKPVVRPKPSPPRSKDCDPVLDFDCDEKKTRSSKKSTLSKSDILSTVKRKIGTINACGRKYGVKGSVKMRWQISKSGKTTNVKTLTSKYKGKPVAKCLESAIRRWKFPAYTGKSPGNIDFPFKLK